MVLFQLVETGVPCVERLEEIYEVHCDLLDEHVVELPLIQVLALRKKLDLVGPKVHVWQKSLGLFFLFLQDLEENAAHLAHKLARLLAAERLAVLEEGRTCI